MLRLRTAEGEVRDAEKAAARLSAQLAAQLVLSRCFTMCSKKTSIFKNAKVPQESKVFKRIITEFISIASWDGRGDSEQKFRLGSV